MSITVFLAEDHRMVREGFRLLIETQPDIRVIGEAGNGREAVKQVVKLMPDVVLMDIEMPELNGIEATLQIFEAHPSTKVIILSMYSTSQHISEVIQGRSTGLYSQRISRGRCNKGYSNSSWRQDFSL